MGWVRPPRPPRPRCLSDVNVANVAVRHGQYLRRGPCSTPTAGLPRTSLQLGSAKEDANSHRPPHYAHMLQRSRLAPSLRLLLGSSSSPIERSIVSRRSLTQGFFAAGLSTRPGCPRGRALPRSRSCTTRAVERLYK
jgi:hypothetical protein